MGNDFNEWWEKNKPEISVLNDWTKDSVDAAEYFARMAWNAAISSAMEGSPEPKCDGVDCNCPDCWRNKE